MTIQVTGTGFQPGWQVLWNGSVRPTTRLNQYRLQVVLPAADTAAPSLSFASVADSSGQTVRPAMPVWVYTAVPNNDFVYDKIRKQLWVAVPTSGGAPANGIASVDPASGNVGSFLTTPAEPQRLCLSDDGGYLYIAMPGRIQRLNTNTLAVDLDFAIPPTAFGSLPPQTYAMAIPPGQPELLVVSVQAPGASPGYSGTTLFDRGVPRPTRLNGTGGPGEFPGWTADGQLIGSDGLNVYLISIAPDGLKLNQTFAISTGGGCKYSAGLLYCSSGVVVDPVKGLYAGSYPAKGNVAALPDVDRIAYIDTGLLTILRLSTGEVVFNGIVPSGNLYGPLTAWGSDGLVWRDAGLNSFNTPATRLYIFHAW